jgi:hypothetical protein
MGKEPLCTVEISGEVHQKTIIKPGLVVHTAIPALKAEAGESQAGPGLYSETLLKKTKTTKP